MHKRLLIADDQSDVLSALRLLLKSEGFSIKQVESPAAILDAMREEQFELVLMDLNYSRDTTSGEEGLEALKAIRRFDTQTPVVIMTAWASISLAVEAMNYGASDFIEKPWDNNRLISVIRNQLALSREVKKTQRLLAENQILKEQPEQAFIAESMVMKDLLQMLERVAPSDANILLTGENGTGKSLIARLIHGMSHRSSQSLITVNMGAVSETVFESEIFGHVKGAFTDAKGDRVGRFELADKGSLFLDEIANIPLSQQGKLLRVLEEGEFERLGSSRTSRVDVRTISATNGNLPEMVIEQKFRQDLLYRLNTVEIKVPSLRERMEDIEPLAIQFLHACAKKCRQPVPVLSTAALACLKKHTWPGNVRELSHVMERASLMCQGDCIEAADLGLMSSAPTTTDFEDMSIEAVEKQLIIRALDRSAGNVNEAAAVLGLSRSAMYRRLEKHEIAH